MSQDGPLCRQKATSSPYQAPSTFYKVMINYMISFSGSNTVGMQIQAAREHAPRLGVAILVAHEHHGHALRQQQRGRQVALLPRAQAQHARRTRWALRAAVPAQVVLLTVPAARGTAMSDRAEDSYCLTRAGGVLYFDILQTS